MQAKASTLGRILELCANAAITVAAIVVIAILLRRDRALDPSTPATPASLSAVSLPDSAWNAILASRSAVETPDGKVQLAVFVDLECPYCARFHQIMRSVQDEFPNDVDVNVVHLPLPQHRFAEPAARAAECARAQYRFDEFVDVVFAKQDSLGLKGWGSFAFDAGVADTSAIVDCAIRRTNMAKVSEGINLSGMVGVQSTPTVVVNGQRLSAPPTAAELRAIVSRILDGVSSSEILPNQRSKG